MKRGSRSELVDLIGVGARFVDEQDRSVLDSLDEHIHVAQRLFMSTIERTREYAAYQHITLKRCINAICLLHVDQSNIVHAVR